MVEKGLKWLEQLWQCFLSIVKILLQSKWGTRLPSSFSNSDELLILANGPSLNRTVEESADFIQGKTLLAVNFCVSSPKFERLRPELYLLPIRCSGLFLRSACSFSRQWPRKLPGT